MDAKRKKGVSHLEMILSFAIFVAFVFFLLFYLNPIKKLNLNKVLLDIVQNRVLENASVKLIETPLIITAISIDIDKQCFSINNPFNTSLVSTENLLVKDSNYALLSYDISADKIEIQKSSGKIYYFYLSPEGIFIGSGGGLSDCQELSREVGDYSISNPREIEIYSYDKIKSLKEKYEDDYLKFKNEFRFPINSDFAIFIKDAAAKNNIPELEMSVKKPENVEVSAVEIPVEIIKNDGTILKAIANIRVW